MWRRYRYNSDVLWRLRQIGGPDLAIRFHEPLEEAPQRQERERQRKPRLRRLRFFTETSTALAISERQFASSFPKSTTRLVYFEIEVAHPWRYVSCSYRVRARYVHTDGSVMGETEGDAVTQSGTETFSCTQGWGWEQPGRWPLGVHRVEILLDGMSFATGEFSIDDDQPSKPGRAPILVFLKDLNRDLEAPRPKLPLRPWRPRK
jgi:hypothetical protein